MPPDLQTHPSGKPGQAPIRGLALADAELLARVGPGGRDVPDPPPAQPPEQPATLSEDVLRTRWEADVARFMPDAGPGAS